MDYKDRTVGLVHGAQRRPETGAPAVPAARVHQGALTARLTEILMHIRRPPGSLRQPPNALRPDKTDREDGVFGVGLGAGVVPSSAVTGTAGQCGYVTGCTMRSASTLANRCCTQAKNPVLLKVLRKYGLSVPGM
jgi:hypothetical protein